MTNSNNLPSNNNLAWIPISILFLLIILAWFYAKIPLVIPWLLLISGVVSFISLLIVSIRTVRNITEPFDKIEKEIFLRLGLYWFVFFAIVLATFRTRLNPVNLNGNFISTVIRMFPYSLLTVLLGTNILWSSVFLNLYRFSLNKNSPSKLGSFFWNHKEKIFLLEFFWVIIVVFFTIIFSFLTF